MLESVCTLMNVGRCFDKKKHKYFLPKYMSLFPVSLTVELSLDHLESQIFDPIAKPWKIMLRKIVAKASVHPMLFK